jgi:mono/diheme cytochrome c family protein
MNYRRLLILSLGILSFAAAGCFRGMPSEKRPIDLVHDMEKQPRYNPQSEGEFFGDDATMRQPVPGTVAQGYLNADSAYYWGRDAGQFIKLAPVHITPQLLARGQERFNIYCSPCHGRVGDGQGIVVKKGYVPPPSFHTDRIRQFPDGQIFDVITHGVRNMPSYASQVPVADRWAIICYIRALQLSQNATLDDVPVELRSNIR